MSYKIEINEYQRALLTKLMRSAMSNVHYVRYLSNEKGEFHDTMYEEAASLLDLLSELPAHEKNHPGVIHGLCL